MMDDGGYAGEPLNVVGEHFPASWQAAREGWLGATSVADMDQRAAGRLMRDPIVPCEITRLRAELDCARAEIGGLRLRLESIEATYRAALADLRAKSPLPDKSIAPVFRAIGARAAEIGLRGI